MVETHWLFNISFLISGHSSSVWILDKMLDKNELC